jgi:adenylosuccinate synthase
MPLGLEEILEAYRDHGRRLASHIADTSGLLYRALRDGKRLLLEGAQGTLLDLDHGTYPFVTSSNPVAGGALTGSGLGPREVDRVIGVTKAYVTRVGSGPFPTEDEGPGGRQMSEVGQEFGVTTGRPRRCGWFDAVLLRYAARVNGLTEIFLTKLDVLSGMKTIRMCVAYRYEGETFEDFPPHQTIVHKAEPVYEDVEGWEGSLREVRSFEDLPPQARSYVERIASLAGVPIRYVSVGPERNSTLQVAA